jgi:hypothetical protein
MLDIFRSTHLPRHLLALRGGDWRLPFSGHILHHLLVRSQIDLCRDHDDKRRHGGTVVLQFRKL